jgi:hypothetical protein
MDTPFVVYGNGVVWRFAMTPGQLVHAVSIALDIPEETVVQHDRNLVVAGLRTKGGRGRSAPDVTPLDAARLLIAALASIRIKDSVEAVLAFERAIFEPGKSLAEMAIDWRKRGLIRPGDVHKSYRTEKFFDIAITVNSTESYHAACVAGLGIIQSVRSGVLPSIAAGEMVEILSHHTCEPLPLSLVHAHGRNVPRHVRAVMNWLAETLKGQLD